MLYNFKLIIFLGCLFSISLSLSLNHRHKLSFLSSRKLSPAPFSLSSSSLLSPSSSHLILNSVKLDSSLSDTEKESKLVPLYTASKFSALLLVALEIPKLVKIVNVDQSLLAVYTYMVAAITAGTLESAAKVIAILVPISMLILILILILIAR